MSIGQDASLQILPVEILHRIFDSLDAWTILLSLRSTCRRLKEVVNSYDRYVLNFKFISKSDFQRLCRLILPEKVISLTLSDEDETLDQMASFISVFSFRQFNRLCSLTLNAINERHVKSILENVNIHSLVSLSLRLGKYDDRCKNSTARLLSSIIEKANLHNLEVDVDSDRVEKIIWAAQSSIQHLRIAFLDTADYICMILRCWPHLRTLVIGSLGVLNTDKNSLVHRSTPFPQLTSLTFEDLHETIENLELFLLLTPSLTHLKLISKRNFLDGNRWEQFIQTNLPLLNKFDFFVYGYRDSPLTPADLQSIITPYRTPFWLEHKKWFVTCEYSIDKPTLIKFYSVPICLSSLTYESDSNKFVLSTFTGTFGNHASIMDNITSFELNCAKLMPADIEHMMLMNSTTTRHSLFCKVTNLKLKFDADWSSKWIPFVSTLIDLTTVVQIILQFLPLRGANPDMLADIAGILQQTCSLSSLDIHYDDFDEKCSSFTADELCSFMPVHVKHLVVSVTNLDEVKIILERLDHLSSVGFYFDFKLSGRKIILWLEQSKKGSTYRTDAFFVHVWLGKSNVGLRELRSGNKKRIKLTEDHHKA